jgi:hypothetical protein
MVQETDKIKDHIDTQRGNLERDLSEIEDRVRKAVDWREWFDRNPVAVIGAAAAGGFALSMLMRRTPTTPRVRGFEYESDFRPASRRLQSSKTSSQINRMADTLDNTVAALIGVASHKFRDFIADIIPNFREEYRDVEASRTSSRANPPERTEATAD